MVLIAQSGAGKVYRFTVCGLGKVQRLICYVDGSPLENHAVIECFPRSYGRIIVPDMSMHRYLHYRKPRHHRHHARHHMVIAGPAPAQQSSPQTVTPQPQGDVHGGTLGCAGLEALWDAAGGNPASQVTAADIAMAESGGNQYATGGVGEEGYWQINPVNTGMATYDPIGNAQSAIALSGNGTNWSPWTTYMSGAYLASGC